MKVGVTGGIGSGKTTVCRVFNTLGIPVFDSDKEAQVIINSDPSVRSDLNSLTGVNLFSSGMLDRKLFAGIIFNDTDMLQRVNELIHPLVIARFEIWAAQQVSPYVIMEAAILFESGAWKNVKKIVSVIAPVEERIKRVSSRSNLPEVEIINRMKNQTDDNDRIARSDFIIHNGEEDLVIPAILQIHQEIINLIRTSK
jgi:dephospho-CoA kinase